MCVWLNLQGFIPAAAWTTAFAAFVKDPSYLDDGSLPSPPPSPLPASAPPTLPGAVSLTLTGAGTATPVAATGSSQPVFIQDSALIRMLGGKDGAVGEKSLPPAEPPLPPGAPRGNGGIVPGGGGGFTGGGINAGAGLRRRQLLQRLRQRLRQLQWQQQPMYPGWRQRRTLLGGGVGSGGADGGGGDQAGGFQSLSVPGNVSLFGHPWFPTILDLSDMVAGLQLVNGSSVALRQLVLVGLAGGRGTQLSSAVPDSGVASGGDGKTGSSGQQQQAPAPPSDPVSSGGGRTSGGKAPSAGARRSGTRRRRLQQAGAGACAAGALRLNRMHSSPHACFTFPAFALPPQLTV